MVAGWMQTAAGPAALVTVGDGDTIRVNDAKGQKVTIRMACIDAPETPQGESGTQATLVLKQLLGAGGLEIRPQTVDRCGRTVAEVYAGGRNVNLEMVRMGLAYAYRQYLGGCDENAYLEAEAQAERGRQGVWRWGNEAKPWDFRKQQRANSGPGRHQKQGLIRPRRPVLCLNLLYSKTGKNSKSSI